MRKIIFIIVLVIIGVLIIGGIIWMGRVALLSRESYPFEPCDLNKDNKCDLTDYNIFENSMNTRQGEDSFNSRADIDTDGYITTNDKIYFLSFFPEDFKVPAEDLVFEDGYEISAK